MGFSTQPRGICTFWFIIQFLERHFRGDSLLFPVCLWLLLGWCHYHALCASRPNLSLRNTKELVQLLSHSRLASDSTGSTDLAQIANKSQPSQLHSFKSHYCSHSWLNSSAFISNEKKKSRLHWTTSRRFLHPQSIWDLSQGFGVCSIPEMSMVVTVLSDRTKSL